MTLQGLPIVLSYKEQRALDLALYAWRAILRRRRSLNTLTKIAAGHRQILELK